MKGIGCLFVLFALVGQPVLGQGRQGPPERMEDKSFIFFQAVNLPSDEPGLSRVDVHFRIDQDFFIALKNDDATFPWEFKRRGELLIELLDSSGISRAREIKRLEIGAHSPEPSFETRRWYQGVASFSVIPGKYSVVFEVDDLESQRKFSQRERIIQARPFSGDTVETSSPLFVLNAQADTRPSILVPQNLGGNILFGSRGGLYIELVSREALAESATVAYRISTTIDRFQEAEVVLSDTLRDLTRIVGPRLALRSNIDSIAYDVFPTDKANRAGFVLPLKLEQLPLRALELHATITIGERTTSIRERFQVVWPEMPLSLRDVDLALHVLQYITKPPQLDSLNRGSFERKRANLEGFWKEKDPTPETAVNEFMTEYYRRVDYAIRTFGTLREPDGWKTDRGRIYIVHGPPSRTERILSPDAGFQEVWSYDSIQKKFIFGDKSKNGNYVLISTGTL